MATCKDSPTTPMSSMGHRSTACIAPKQTPQWCLQHTRGNPNTATHETRKGGHSATNTTRHRVAAGAAAVATAFNIGQKPWPSVSYHGTRAAQAKVVKKNITHEPRSSNRLMKSAQPHPIKLKTYIRLQLYPAHPTACRCQVSFRPPPSPASTGWRTSYVATIAYTVCGSPELLIG